MFILKIGILFGNTSSVWKGGNLFVWRTEILSGKRTSARTEDRNSVWDQVISLFTELVYRYIRKIESFVLGVICTGSHSYGKQIICSDVKSPYGVCSTYGE